MIVANDYDARWSERFEELRQRLGVGVGNGITLCDLCVFVYEAAESIASMDASVVCGGGWPGVGESVRRPLSEGSVRPVWVVVLRVLTHDEA